MRFRIVTFHADLYDAGCLPFFSPYQRKSRTEFKQEALCAIRIRYRLRGVTPLVHPSTFFRITKLPIPDGSLIDNLIAQGDEVTGCV